MGRSAPPASALDDIAGGERRQLDRQMAGDRAPGPETGSTRSTFMITVKIAARPASIPFKM